MTDYDPFASAPADEPNAGASTAATGNHKAPSNTPNSIVTAESKVVVTLKGGPGYEAPWIVHHADSIEEAEALVKGSVELMRMTQLAAQKFAEYAPSSNKPSGNGQAQRPARQAPPDGAPEAPGPDWVYKTGISKKNGKTWQAWMPPQGSNDSPVFF
ncbi:hypothetical protein [Nocardia arthritidis]|uniref:Uncharacterized protein n=1 Tax=Nocardia arthritidis TaxID=228602 RepID=A0A6G9YT18_9NOCA|nr:hypothetical protein [Nocardia arthritidis]QIS16445.1 hypothetical protein F5544_43190 [Nocardia arthritidis]QIS16459.1 hypothetical protein F5544_43260 [Nocardia arthritidis]